MKKKFHECELCEIPGDQIAIWSCVYNVVHYLKYTSIKHAAQVYVST